MSFFDYYILGGILPLVIIESVFFLMSWIFNGFSILKKDPENNFAENTVLNEMIGVNLLLGIPIISGLVIVNLTSSFFEKDPLGGWFTIIFLTSTGYTIFFFQGSALVKFFKFTLIFFLLSFLWIEVISDDKYMEIMKKSCAAGRSVACEQVEIMGAIEALPSKEDIEKLEEDLRKDIEMREAIKRKHGG